MRRWRQPSEDPKREWKIEMEWPHCNICAGRGAMQHLDLIAITSKRQGRQRVILRNLNEAHRAARVRSQSTATAVHRDTEFERLSVSPDSPSQFIRSIGRPLRGLQPRLRDSRLHPPGRLIFIVDHHRHSPANIIYPLRHMDQRRYTQE